MSDSDSENSGGEGTSSGVVKKRKYVQTYKEKWEKLPEFRGWVTKSKKGESYAKCTPCNKDIIINSGKDALIKHSISKIHQIKVNTLSKQQTLTAFAAAGGSAIEEDIKKGEIRLAALVAEHNLPFAVMDHLIQLLKVVCHDSKIAIGMVSGRKKTTAIVKHVLGQRGFNTLCEHLRRNKFSLIVDESTDRTTTKHMCMVVRTIFKNYTVSDNFLALIQLSGADAQTLYNEIVTFFEKNNIPWKDNLIGFASDGANVMMGEYHSVMSLLRNDIPSLYIMKCICHSFHLCASYACQKLPRFVEDLTRDVYNYFGSSPKRISEFAEFQTFCNLKIHKILHPSQTRWLSVLTVVKRILEQYNALQLYFTEAVSNRDILAAENILSKLNDPTTKLFLQFLEFALPFFNNLNKEMQSESPQLHLIYKNLCTILRSIFDCFINREYLQGTSIENIDFKNPRNFLNINNMYFGANVSRTLSENQQLTEQQISFFKLRCLEFYIESCTQITQRFELKNNKLELLNIIDPAVVKAGSVDSISQVLLSFPNLLNTPGEELHLQQIDNEWRLLRNTQEIQLFSNDVELFWQEVRALKYGDSSLMFDSLTTFIFNLLCLPHSSANVERVFSAINLMKTKQRNKLLTRTIEGLLFSKQYIGQNNCHGFVIDRELTKLMTKVNLYRDESESQEDQD